MPRSLPHRVPLLIVFLVLGLPSCADLTRTADDGPFIDGYLTDRPVPAHNTTFQDPAVFRVYGPDGPVDDVEVRFTARGDASLEPTSAYTDSDGVVRTWITVGDEPGRVYVTARIGGTTDSAVVSFEPLRRTLELTPDTLRLIVGCALRVQARVGPSETFNHDPEEVDPGILFELSDPSLAHLQRLGGTDYRRPKRGVNADRPGTADLVASLEGAAPDTTPVTVLPKSEAVPGSVDIWSADTVSVGAAHASVSGSVADIGGCWLTDEPITYLSRDPEVLEVVAEPEEWPSSTTSASLRPHRTGSAWIVGQAGEFADSTFIVVE